MSWNHRQKPAPELLEPRMLLHAGHVEGFHVHVNFQPGNATVPSGYLMDSGKTFADRGNGYFYGWDTDRQSQTRDRNSPTSASQLYDTLIHTQQGGAGTWEMAIPNGRYILTLVGGDPTYTGDAMAFSAEGQTVLQGKTAAYQRWLESQTIVDVSDGRLTIASASGAINNKLCFLTITESFGEETQVKLTTIDPAATEGADTATARVTRFGPLDQPLVVQYKVAGTALDGGDFVSLPGFIEIPAGQASADIVIEAIDDSELEPGETVEITLLPAEGYAMRYGQFSSLVISDNEPSETRQPYFGVPVRLSATIEAENFDYGPSGIAYQDNTAGNSGGLYRSGGVDITATSDALGGFAVTALRVGEWLTYTIDVPVSGTYRIETRVASATSGGGFHIEFNGSNKTGTLNLPGTGSWQTWKTITKTGVQLTAGVQTMKIKVDRTNVSKTDVGSINWVRIYHDLTPAAKLTWTSATSSPFAREEAQGMAVDDNLYVFGGLYTGSYLATKRLDIFNKPQNKWSSGAEMPEAITHAPTVLVDGKIWIIGGYTGDHPGPSTSHVWIYDPQSNSYSSGPELPEARGAGAASIIGRRIHFVGGRNPDRNVDQTTHWMYDLDNPDAGWIEKAPLKHPRNHVSSAVIDGKLYVIAGQQLEEIASVNLAELSVYDPQTDTWSAAADVPMPLSHVHQATIVRNGKLIVLGGQIAHNVFNNEVLMYNPANNLWSYLGALPGARRAGVAGLVGNNLLFTGGFNGGSMQKSMWVGTLQI